MIKLCVTNENDSSICILSLWLILGSSIIARNGKYALKILMLNFTEYFYTFPLTYASFPISKPAVGFPEGSCFLTSNRGGSNIESKIKWLTPIPPDGQEDKQNPLNRGQPHSPNTYTLMLHVFLRPYSMSGSVKSFKCDNLFYLLVAK